MGKGAREDWSVSVRELVVLGTASQLPPRHRNHNGYLVRFDGAGFLFDPGEGTQRQLTFADVSATQVSAICITHFHGDHCLGVPGMLQRLAFDGVERVDLAYPASGQPYLDRLRHASISDARARITTHPLAGKETSFAHRGLIVHALPLDHRVESWGYRVEEPRRRNFVPERLAAAGIEGPALGELERDGE